MRRRLAILGALALVGAGLLGAAPAGGGTLDFGPPGQPGISDFAPVTLNGAPQLTSLAIDAVLRGRHDRVGRGLERDAHCFRSRPTAARRSPRRASRWPRPRCRPRTSESMTGVAGHATTGNLSTGEKIVTAGVGDGDGTYLVSPVDPHADPSPRHDRRRLHRHRDDLGSQRPVGRRLHATASVNVSKISAGIGFCSLHVIAIGRSPSCET